MNVKLELYLDRLKYILGIYPDVWQLPNPLKIYEYDALVKGVSLQRGQRILDLGCGQGIQAQLLAKHGPCVMGVDPGAKQIRNAIYKLKWSRVRQRVQFMQGTVEALPLPENHFDYVMSFCVLEHIPKLECTLDVLHAVLKRGGEIHCTVDALSNIKDNKIIDAHRYKYNVHRYFRPNDLVAFFSQAGFEVLQQKYILSSRLAVQEFSQEVEKDGLLRSQEERKRAYHQLTKEEESANHDSGIMIWCRARKPA